jgi:hypothetical protein
MELTLAAGVSILLLTATVLIHYELLRLASGMMLWQFFPKRARMLLGILVVLVAHIAEIGLYAAALSVCQNYLRLGVVAGEIQGGILDLLYFSTATYTTLGIGDLYPRGSLRLIVGIESLNGLVLIGWSASFTYLSMEKFWDDARRVPSGSEAAMQ